MLSSVGDLADGGDRVGVDRDIATVERSSRAVGDGAVADDDVVRHGSPRSEDRTEASRLEQKIPGTHPRPARSAIARDHSATPRSFAAFPQMTAWKQSSGR